MILSLAHTHHTFHTRSLPLRDLTVIPLCQRPLVCHMPLPTTKSGWVELLRTMGESVPSSWNMAQIHAHWIDMQKGDKTMEVTSLEDKLKQLRRASRKKENLQNFLKEEDVEFSGNMTIAQLMGVGEKQITKRFPPLKTENMGFGRHGHLTYEEVAEKFPSYVTWACQTVQEEDDPGWRLIRFVEWATHHQEQDMKKTVKPPKGSKTESSASSFSVVEPDVMKERAELEQMKGILQAKMREMEAKEQALTQKEEENFPHAVTKTRREM